MPFFNVTLSLLRGPSRPSVLGSLATLGADRTKRGLARVFRPDTTGACPALSRGQKNRIHLPKKAGNSIGAAVNSNLSDGKRGKKQREIFQKNHRRSCGSLSYSLQIRRA